MRVDIYLNAQLDAEGRHAAWARIPEGYAEGDALRYVGGADVDPDCAHATDCVRDALAVTYERMQNLDPSHDTRTFLGTATRSLSIGDVVLLGGRAWAVAPHGWDEVRDIDAAIAAC